MSSLDQPLDSATREYLRGLKRRGVVLGLDRMRGFARALGNPQDRIPAIHIGGTNGKGSVAAMVEAIFRAAGWRTGLYTSPHLIRIGERIQVDREPLGTAELADQARELRIAAERCVERHGPEAQPSYFEFMTALAFAHFARSHCDIAIVEVGMGGRLDATNVVTPEVAAIVSIGLDHTEFLGNAIETIAAEKAGIVKRGRPVVIGRLPPEAERIVRNVAEAQSSAVISVREELGDDLRGYPTTNLSGAHQRVNAAVAALIARQFDVMWRINEATIAQALQNVTWAGRWQELEVDGRRVIVDAAHNREGAVALEANLAELPATSGTAPIVIVGVLGSARAKPLLEAICRHAGEVHLVRPNQPRASSVDELAALIPASYQGRIVRDTIESLFPSPGHCALKSSPLTPVVVTGSIYLAGEVLARIDPSVGPLDDDLQDF